jgi:hypothetical protein
VGFVARTRGVFLLEESYAGCEIKDKSSHGSFVTANTSLKHFHPNVSPLVAQTIVMADFGLRSAEGYPENMNLCPKEILNERMIVETVLSMVTVVCASSAKA